MSDFDDNATGFDLDKQLEYADQEMELIGAEVNQKSVDIPEITQLMKQFAGLCLKYTVNIHAYIRTHVHVHICIFNKHALCRIRITIVCVRW